MKCPKCGSEHIRKNGIQKGKQNHICAECGRQFINPSEQTKAFPETTKQTCLKMYLNGMGFRAIERVMGVHHTTVIDWVKQKGKKLPDAIAPDNIPDVGEWDELETFVGFKKNKIWVWTAVDHFPKGILAWTLGDHSAETFEPGQVAWQCYFYVTDGWTVYPSFIPDGDQSISKTDMTRVEGENSRLGHYLARLHRNTFCYSKSVDMLRYSVRLLIHYLHDSSVLFSS
ncbi:MAG: IS1 family transposase [Cyanobacteria bacterium LVE1205-1]